MGPRVETAGVTGNISSASAASSADLLTGFKSASNSLNALIEQKADKYGVPARLVKAVIEQESRFKPTAESRCGAQGLMQLMPGTAKDLGCTDPFNPEQNIEAGTKYLAGLLKRYNGNVKLALAAYNAGPGNVAKFGNAVPPFKETQEYVANITARFTGTQVDVGSISAATTKNGVRTYEGSQFGVLPSWFENLRTLVEVPEGANWSLEDAVNEVEAEHPERSRDELLREIGTLNADKLKNGRFPAGTAVRLPYPATSSDGYKDPATPPVALATPDTGTAPPTDPSLRAKVTRTIPG